MATAASSSQINLTWVDNATNEDGFHIERSTDNINFMQAATVDANRVSYSDTGLNANTLYYYRIRAFNSGGNSTYSNTASATTLPAAPAAPSNLAATSASSSQVNLNWTDSSNNEVGFKIERCSGADCTDFVQIAQTGANQLSYINKGLAANTSYSYRVRAYNSGGDSSYSNTASATTSNLVAAPSNLGGTSTKDTINLQWTDNSNNETGFKIERSTNGVNFTLIFTAASNVTSYSNTGLTANTFYHYRVRAYNGVGDSANSNVIKVKTKNR
jgi:hypothetical protein